MYINYKWVTTIYRRVSDHRGISVIQLAIRVPHLKVSQTEKGTQNKYIYTRSGAEAHTEPLLISDSRGSCWPYSVKSHANIHLLDCGAGRMRMRIGIVLE